MFRRYRGLFMGFPNVKRILKIGSPLSSYKLLLMAARFSRPKYKNLCLWLLQPFVRNGEVLVRYRCYDRFMKVFIRMSDLESDYMSTLELGVIGVYRLEGSFQPDLVIDGGGNIGLFTLRAAAFVSRYHGSPVKFVICEPVPSNINQIKKNLKINEVQADLMQVCLGGTYRVIPFYCREANQSSFDPVKAYASVMEVPVVLLRDALGSAPAERILIKLDIEGMEIEALSSFVPSEQRAVCIIGELHNFEVNAPLMEKLFRDHGWAIELYDIADNLSSFRACSPAALPLLPSMSHTNPATAAAV